MSNKRDDPDTATDNVRQTHKFSRMSEAEKTARRRYLMFIEYNGNDFSGSQRQKDGVRTVQAECETALTEMTKEVRSALRCFVVMWESMHATWQEPSAHLACHRDTTGHCTEPR